MNSRNSKGIFQEAVFDPANPAILKPKNPEFLIDKKYIMAAMGLLGDKYPEIAIRMLKKELKAVV